MGSQKRPTRSIRLLPRITTLATAVLGIFATRSPTSEVSSLSDASLPETQPFKSSYAIFAEAATYQPYYSVAPIPDAEAIVRRTTVQYVSRQTSLAAALLRMHFHDCFVRVSLLHFSAF